MLVIPAKQKLVINSKARAQILAAIPHAKEFQHEGQYLVAVPHEIEECLVLRNLGFKEVPSPILSYYDWPGQLRPMGHQKATAGFVTTHRKALVLSDPGTGKTAACLWGADFLLKKGLVKKVLIVTPLSVIKSVWGSEIRAVLPSRSYNYLIGSAQDRADALNEAGVQFHIINHDGFNIVKDHLGDVDLVIYDEATALKNPSTRRFRGFFMWVRERNPWLWMLTGTPIAQSPVDAWSLAKLVGNPYVKPTFYGFKDQVMRKVSMYRWVPAPEALAVCKQVLQPSVRYALDECVDLPDMVYDHRQVDLTPQQLAAFKEMQEKAILAVHNVSAANAAVLLMKLIQICCGVVYDNHGKDVVLDAAPRFDALCELIDEIGSKVIVFVPLRSVQEWLYTHLKARYSVVSVHGDVSGKDRANMFAAFQTKEAPQVLLAHPVVTAHGLTLTAANTVIWYAPIYSLEKYEQANARIRRVGTKGKTRAVHLYSTAFERELYRRLAAKRRILADFLDLVKTS